jgi:diacylglycerol O-acyltransferase / wax synthase
MDRLSALDAGFWEFEDDHAALHIGAIAVFEGPPPTHAEIAAQYRVSLDLTPRYRQKMRRSWLGLRRPVWVDDPEFDLDYHLRRTALAAPGEKPELERLVGRLMTTHLDPSRPLWEAWVIEGLSGGEWALVFKLHHSLVDGVGGMALFTDLLSATPGDEAHRRAARPAERSDWARPLATLVSTARHPRRVVRGVVAGVRGVVEYLPLLRPTAANSLSGPLGAPRRYRTVTVDFADVARVKAAFGGTVNDVALAMITAGFRDLLASRGEPLEPRSVRSMVPVSLRSEAELHDAANRVTILLVDLPVEVLDPIAAYRAVTARTGAAKSSSEASTGHLSFAMADLLPAPVVARSMHVFARLPQRIITTVTTNVPGPRSTAYLLGRRMLALYPYVPIADRIRIGVAISSYDGALTFGVTCDRDSVPDADVLTAGMTAGLTELVKLAV